MEVTKVYREEKISKAGNPYQQLVIVFENGYSIRHFLNDEQQYILHDVPLVK